jgi:hypothetical protein
MSNSSLSKGLPTVVDDYEESATASGRLYAQLERLEVQYEQTMVGFHALIKAVVELWLTLWRTDST